MNRDIVVAVVVAADVVDVVKGKYLTNMISLSTFVKCRGRQVTFS